MQMKEIARAGVLVDHGPRADEKRQFPKPPAHKGEDDSPCAPSRHLWVGNVAHDTPEAIVREKFVKFGELESVTVYPQRQYAFVNFRRQEDAEKAKEGLHGATIGGLQMRIEFAKGARPSRHLWVTGIAPSVSKETLEAEFQKHGHVEDFKFMKDKSAAYVDYTRTDDAINALAALNGKRFCDEELRIDYRSTGSKRPAAPPPVTSSAPRGGGKDDTPSEVLWIGLPTNAKFDEEMIHRLFAPFGEIERVKLFASRSYCFVEFRSVREAALAKNALSGKPINGYRLHIEFSTSEIGPVEGKEEPPEAIAKKSRVSPNEQLRPRLGSPFSAPQENGSNTWGWQGLIAKGGTALCQVRGFPAAGKVDTIIPEVVNCTARTDLDMLAKHVYPGTDFTVVVFLPVRDVDVTPYQDFLHYLREKHRAGVAKLGGDGTTLFLVPPSPFSEKVLKATRNDCLFGVVLNFRQQNHQSLQQFQTAQQQPQQPAGFNLPPEIIAQLNFQQQQNGAVSGPPGYLPIPAAAWPDQQQQQHQHQQQPLPPNVVVPPPLVAFNEPNPTQFQPQQAQQMQQAHPVNVPQLPMDQLAQLTALFKQTQQQQQQQQREHSPLPPHQQAQQQQQQAAAGAWPPQAPAPNASANLPQFQDPELVQRTVALAAQLLKKMQDKSS